MWKIEKQSYILLYTIKMIKIVNNKNNNILNMFEMKIQFPQLEIHQHTKIKMSLSNSVLPIEIKK